jgi:hypothetical protein
MKNLKTFLVGAASYLTVGQVVATDLLRQKNPQPIGLQFAKDEGLLSAVLRVQRNFCRDSLILVHDITSEPTA